MPFAAGSGDVFYLFVLPPPLPVSLACMFRPCRIISQPHRPISPLAGALPCFTTTSFLLDRLPFSTDNTCTSFCTRLQFLADTISPCLVLSFPYGHRFSLMLFPLSIGNWFLFFGFLFQLDFPFIHHPVHLAKLHVWQFSSSTTFNVQSVCRQQLRPPPPPKRRFPKETPPQLSLDRQNLSWLTSDSSLSRR